MVCPADGAEHVACVGKSHGFSGSRFLNRGLKQTSLSQFALLSLIKRRCHQLVRHLLGLALCPVLSLLFYGCSVYQFPTAGRAPHASVLTRAVSN